MRAGPAATSIPVTVPRAVFATSPATSAVKVAKPGAVKHPRRFPDTAKKHGGSVESANMEAPSRKDESDTADARRRLPPAEARIDHGSPVRATSVEIGDSALRILRRPTSLGS